MLARTHARLALVTLAMAAILGGLHGVHPARAMQPASITLSPASGPVGTVVTVTGTGFSLRDNVAQFGKGYIKNLESKDGKTVRLEIPDGLDLCAPDATGPCPGAFPPVRPGEYVVSVRSGSRTSATATFTVTP